MLYYRETCSQDRILADAQHVSWNGYTPRVHSLPNIKVALLRALFIVTCLPSHADSVALSWACAAPPLAVSIHAFAMSLQSKCYLQEHIGSACRELSGMASSIISECLSTACFGAKSMPGQHAQTIPRPSENDWAKGRSVCRSRWGDSSAFLPQLTST